MENTELKELSMPSWMPILIEIERHPDSSLSNVGRKTNITYAHVAKTIDLLIEYGLVKKTSVGREMNLLVTEPGRKAAQALLLVRTILDAHPNDKTKQVRLDEEAD